MRKILFRAKSLEKDNLGEWIYGDLNHTSEFETYIVPQYREYGEIYNDGIMIDEKTVGQFVGLHDKNRKEIYEGDIIKMLRGIYKVVWSISDVSFRLERWITKEDGVKEVSFFITPYHESYVEVIGNIIDNPELIENNDEDK